MSVQELREINARFIHNFVTNDARAHGRLLHEAFVAIQSDGSVLDRATYLARWPTGFDPDVIPYWDTRGETITVVGDVALVRSTNVFVVVSDGAETKRATTYTDTYLRREGRWLCVQAQLTPVAPPYVPGVDTIVSVYVRGEMRKSA